MACNHIWNRTNGAVDKYGRDSFRCEKCGKTGHSLGLGGVENVFEDYDKKRLKHPDRDYAREYARRKFWKDLEKRLGQPSGLEWSMEQYNLRLAVAQQGMKPTPDLRLAVDPVIDEE